VLLLVRSSSRGAIPTVEILLTFSVPQVPPGKSPARSSPAEPKSQYLNGRDPLPRITKEATGDILAIIPEFPPNGRPRMPWELIRPPIGQLFELYGWGYAEGRLPAKHSCPPARPRACETPDPVEELAPGCDWAKFAPRVVSSCLPPQVHFRYPRPRSTSRISLHVGNIRPLARLY